MTNPTDKLPLSDGTTASLVELLERILKEQKEANKILTAMERLLRPVNPYSNAVDRK